jgi:hypothetical protein
MGLAMCQRLGTDRYRIDFDEGSLNVIQDIVSARIEREIPHVTMPS